MKLLFFADVHLDMPFVWANREVARRRRQALRDVLASITQLATDTRVDALVCGGDLYEQERFSADTREFLKTVFGRLEPLPVFIAPGNHDWLSPESLYQQVDWTPNVRVFRNDYLDPIELTEGLTLWGGAHVAPANTDGFLDDFSVDRGGIHLALFHGSELGWLSAQEPGKVPHAPFQAQQVRASGIHHALVGHYHTPKDADAFTYPGNPDPLTFGESGPRGPVLVTVNEDGSVERQRFSVALTAAHDLTVNVTGSTNQQDIREQIRTQLQGLQGVARVTLFGELASDVDLRPGDLETVAPWMDAVVLRLGALRVAYDLDAIKDERTVRGEFVRQILATSLPEDERAAVLATGLRAFEDREDLEVPANAI